MRSTTQASVRFAVPLPGPVLPALSALAYLSGAIGVGLGVVFWTDGMNPRWVLATVTLLFVTATGYALARGTSYTVTEAQVALLVATGLLAVLSFTTELAFGALRNGIAVPLLGVYAGWYFRRPATWCFYLTVGAWFVAVAVHDQPQLTVIAAALAVQAVLGLEVTRILVHRLRRVARIDPLTGALNRLGLNELGHGLVAEARRTNAQLSIALIDLDGLRDINNRGGHAEGDALLRQACSELLDSLGPADAVGRLGGDEFLMLMPRTELVEATRTVKALEETATVRWTAGLAELEGEESFDDLVRRADHGMYERKFR